MRYKSGSTWTDVPDEALYGTYSGTAHVQWPKTTDFNGNGKPCAAVGKPEIIIRTPWMPDSGMDFWRGLFSSESATSASVSLEVFDERKGEATKYSGYLMRPEFTSISIGSTAAQTIYRNVTIRVVNCTETT